MKYLIFGAVVLIAILIVYLYKKHQKKLSANQNPPSNQDLFIQLLISLFHELSFETCLKSREAIFCNFETEETSNGQIFVFSMNGKKCFLNIRDAMKEVTFTKAGILYDAKLTNLVKGKIKEMTAENNGNEIKPKIPAIIPIDDKSDSNNHDAAKGPCKCGAWH